MSSIEFPKECLVCLNSIKTTFASTEESQKIFNICCSYVKYAINIEFLINHINGNNNKLSFCKNCIHSSLNISSLVEQLSKLKKEINDRVSCFSETISKQRFQAKNNPAIIQAQNGDSQSHIPNNQSPIQMLPDRLLLHGIPSDSEKDSFMHSFSELIDEKISHDEICSEVENTENDEILLDCENKSDTYNVSGYKERETSDLVNENENEVQSLGKIHLESTYGTVSNCIDVDQSMPHIWKPKLLPELISSVIMPKVVLSRIRNSVISTGSGTTNSCKSLNQNKPAATFYRNNSRANSNCNTTNKKTTVKLKKTHKKTNVKNKNTNKKRKKQFKCMICQNSFYRPYDVNRHMMTHTGEKPYKCDVCGKAFRRSNDLKDHERDHTGEKPFKCPFCELPFKSKPTLLKHKKKHHRPLA